MKEADFLQLIKKYPSLSLRKYNNPQVETPRFPFQYESCDEPCLETLRRKYKLEKVIAPGKTEFDKMVLLREWVMKRWRHGDPRDKSKAAAYNALEILENAKKGEQFYCHHYTITYIQCCLALGWQARFIAIETSGPFGHSTMEVWSNQYQKWVMMDPDYNVHYTFKGIPQNALDLHRIWITGSARDVPKVLGDSRDLKVVLGHPRPRFKSAYDTPCIRFLLLDFYFSFSIVMGNDYFRNGVSGNRPSLRLIDQTTPCVQAKADYIMRKRYRTTWFCDRPEDLYWPLNQTQISFKIAEKGMKLLCSFDTFTPDFESFHITMNGKKIKMPENQITWDLGKGVNRLAVQSANRFGSKGPLSEIILRRK